MSSKKHGQKAKPPEPQVKTGIDASKITTPPEISPDDIPIRLKEDIRGWKREADKYKEYFISWKKVSIPSGKPMKYFCLFWTILIKWRG